MKVLTELSLGLPTGHCDFMLNSCRVGGPVGPVAHGLSDQFSRSGETIT